MTSEEGGSREGMGDERIDRREEGDGGRAIEQGKGICRRDEKRGRGGGWGRGEGEGGG